MEYLIRMKWSHSWFLRYQILLLSFLYELLHFSSLPLLLFFVFLPIFGVKYCLIDVLWFIGTAVARNWFYIWVLSSFLQVYFFLFEIGMCKYLNHHVYKKDLCLYIVYVMTWNFFFQYSVLKPFPNFQDRWKERLRHQFQNSRKRQTITFLRSKQINV